ncbi:MAG TPA: hypothetical protein VFB06_09640 [Streptosporangiaceae bacterium]|nr:hypothetical protein [Streptosporangiaceae bacterium]
MNVATAAGFAMNAVCEPRDRVVVLGDQEGASAQVLAGEAAGVIEAVDTRGQVRRIADGGRRRGTVRSSAAGHQ